METNTDPVSNARPKVSGSTVAWGIAAFILAIIVCTKNDSALVLEAGFLAKCFAVVVGTALGLLGAVLGNAIRRFAQPDMVYTNGGFFQLIWIKVFWNIGPQVIGLFIGVFVGCAVILH